MVVGVGGGFSAVPVGGPLGGGFPGGGAVFPPLGFGPGGVSYQAFGSLRPGSVPFGAVEEIGNDGLDEGPRYTGVPDVIAKGSGQDVVQQEVQPLQAVKQQF